MYSKQIDWTNLCSECGLEHNQHSRLHVLKRLRGTPIDQLTPSRLYELMPERAEHLWPLTKSGRRLLNRDLAKLRGKKSPGNVAAHAMGLERGRKGADLVEQHGISAWRASMMVHTNHIQVTRELRRRGYVVTRRIPHRWVKPATNDADVLRGAL